MAGKTMNEIWRNAYKPEAIKVDGIINPILWENAKPKILVICKEPNDPDQGDGNYSDWFNENAGADYPFSKQLGIWAYGMFNNFPPIEKALEEADNYRNALRSIAFLNIKKSGGGPSSDWNIIGAYAQQHATLLRDQIALIQPEVIITCTSFNDTAWCAIFPDDKCSIRGDFIHSPIWKGILRPNNQFSTLADPVWLKKDITMIDFYHPSNRFPRHMNYYYLEHVWRHEHPIPDSD